MIYQRVLEYSDHSVAVPLSLVSMVYGASHCSDRTLFVHASQVSRTRLISTFLILLLYVVGIVVCVVGVIVGADMITLGTSVGVFVVLVMITVQVVVFWVVLFAILDTRILARRSLFACFFCSIATFLFTSSCCFICVVRLGFSITAAKELL